MAKGRRECQSRRSRREGRGHRLSFGSSEQGSAALSAKVEILLIGFGNMGHALVRGWLAKGRDPSSIEIVDPVPAARAVAAELGVVGNG